MSESVCMCDEERKFEDTGLTILYRYCTDPLTVLFSSFLTLLSTVSQTLCPFVYTTCTWQCQLEILYWCARRSILYTALSWHNPLKTGVAGQRRWANEPSASAKRGTAAQLATTSTTVLAPTVLIARSIPGWEFEQLEGESGAMNGAMPAHQIMRHAQSHVRYCAVTNNLCVWMHATWSPHIV